MKQIYEAEKELQGELCWFESDGVLRLSCSLAIHGVLLEGLELYARTNVEDVDKDVVFMLRTGSKKSGYELLERICWRPKRPHSNKGRGPKKHRFTLITGGHVHSMYLNWYAEEGRMLKSNLPIAEPLDINSLNIEEVFNTVITRFSIKLIGQKFEAPPWQRDLFDYE
ncbi:hypothetical protein [Hirschia baltica]|uniref:hypothetical protein n=1 Tax=Hirschia baltica TaxID=2724 RepID=UPI0011EA6312|nr:hypothetical protein [Hirschia baltica]